MVMLVDGVIRAFVDCCDDGIAAHIAVILVTCVPQIAVKEKHIAWLHHDWHKLIPLESCLNSWIVNDSCLIPNPAMVNSTHFVTTT